MIERILPEQTSFQSDFLNISLHPLRDKIPWYTIVLPPSPFSHPIGMIDKGERVVARISSFCCFIKGCVASCFPDILLSGYLSPLIFPRLSIRLLDSVSFSLILSHLVRSLPFPLPPHPPLSVSHSFTFFPYPRILDHFRSNLSLSLSSLLPCGLHFSSSGPGQGFISLHVLSYPLSSFSLHVMPLLPSTRMNLITIWNSRYTISSMPILIPWCLIPSRDS